MNKYRKIGILIAIFIFVFLGHQIYTFYKYNGNLILNISNESEIDKLNLSIYIDGEKQFSEIYSNQYSHAYKEKILKTKLGKHILLIKSDDKTINV